MESLSSNTQIVALEGRSVAEKLGINMLNNSVTSGNIFSGRKLRKFPDGNRRFKGKIAPIEGIHSEYTIPQHVKKNRNKLDCNKWAVVTTIFEPPSEAVRRFLYRKEWCVVVVGDKEKPGEVILLMQPCVYIYFKIL